MIVSFGQKLLAIEVGIIRTELSGFLNRWRGAFRNRKALIFLQQLYVVAVTLRSELVIHRNDYAALSFSLIPQGIVDSVPKKNTTVNIVDANNTTS